MNTEAIVIDPNVIPVITYLLLALLSAVLALISARIAASTVNVRLYKMATELSKWQVYAIAVSLVMSFTTTWGLPGWLTQLLAVGITIIVLK